MPEGVSLLMAFLSWALVAVPERAPMAAVPPRVTGKIREPTLIESSALCASPKVPGRFWSLNDSGHPPRLFALDVDGAVLAPPVKVTGAKNRDWESLCADGKGGLWIGDVGNNANKRKSLEIHRVDEPGKEIPESLPVTRTLRFRYPDQEAFPPEKMNFDCEAIFYFENRIYLLTKHRSDTDTKLYRIHDVDSGEIQTAELRGRFSRIGQVTGAALHADGRRLAVLTYSGVWIFEPEADSDRFLQGAGRHFRYPNWSLRQSEGIAWIDAETLLIGNEQKDLFRLRTDAPGWRAFKGNAAEFEDESR